MRTATSDPQRAPLHKRVDRWIGKHRWLILILIIFTVLVPICAGIIAQNHFNDRSANVIVSALVGWPEFQSDSSNELVALGVCLSAFAVFGIPTVLGAVITILLENAGRNFAMSIWKYLEGRDEFIVGYVFSEFKDLLGDQVDEEIILQTAANAIQEASRVWRHDTDAEIASELETIPIPRPSGEEDI